MSAHEFGNFPTGKNHHMNPIDFPYFFVFVCGPNLSSMWHHAPRKCVLDNIFFEDSMVSSISAFASCLCFLLKIMMLKTANSINKNYN